MRSFIFGIVLLSLLAAAGCVRSLYKSEEYTVADGKALPTRKVYFEYNAAMLNERKSDLHVVLGDGASLDAGDIVRTADPNSARAIGDAVRGISLP